MRLTQVSIHNFRSIAHADIEFEPRCRVLVGINESGKTNILRALSLINKEIRPSHEDIRESLPNEPPVENGYVDFMFKLDKPDLEKSVASIKYKVLGNVETYPIAISNGNEIGLGQYVLATPNMVYRVDLFTGLKYWLPFSDPDVAVISSWKKPKKIPRLQLRIQMEK